MFSTDIHYEVVSFSVGDTKAGTKMGKLQLKDPSTEAILNCVLWEEALNRLDVKLFRIGNIVRIVTASFNERFNNCLITSLELIKEAKMGLSEEERNSVFDEILGYINNIQNQDLKTFLLNYFEEHAEQIKVSPAAKTMHHNYIGGLLVHTLECIKIAEANINILFQDINKDEAMAACILHDIGKIYEYTINVENGMIDYDDTFKKEWLTHSQYGYTLCMSKGFKRIAKMIAAHHGRIDWGAIVDLNEKDLESYVYFIHHIDDLSAKYGKTSVTML